MIADDTNHGDNRLLLSSRSTTTTTTTTLSSSCCPQRRQQPPSLPSTTTTTFLSTSHQRHHRCLSSSSSSLSSPSSSSSLPSFSKSVVSRRSSISLYTDIFHHRCLSRSRWLRRRSNGCSTTTAFAPQSRTFNLFLVILCFVPALAQALTPLNDYVRHYEPLAYDHTPVLHALDRSRRAASQYASSPEHPNANPAIDLDFVAHGRRFSLRLKRDTRSVFHPDLVIEDGDGRPLSVDLDHLVSGHLREQPDSHVYGSVRGGVFEGRIHTRTTRSLSLTKRNRYKRALDDDRDDDQDHFPAEKVFYVERSQKYFSLDPVTIFLLSQTSRPNATQSRKYDLYDLLRSEHRSRTASPAPDAYALPFHSVIYSSEHVVDPHHSHRSPFDGACGANAEVRAWMDRVANSATDDNAEDDSKRQESTTTMKKINDEDSMTFSQRIAAGNINQTWSRREKRATNFYHNYRVPSEAQGRVSYSRPTMPPQPSSPMLPSKRACSLYIQTDTFLWDHVKKHESEKSDFKVREEIASLVAQHIKAVNHIYETSIFKDIIGLKFIVQRLRINDSSSCDATKRETNHFCSPNIDVSNFLNLNSQFNHNDFCLAYIFTYRDFSGGTLGLAWVASTSGASGGICEKYKTYTENIGGRQVQTKRSLNTGIITFVNYNSRVPPKVSELTLAHEIGHNFGSPHDYPAECRPGGPAGNFIMYSSATSGERQNNNKFSHCSISNISMVLHAVFGSEGKENCFQEDNGPFCGNKIVEEGEECDCGYDSRECNEDCCYPRNVEEFKQKDPYALPCRRRPGAYCSPSEGPCCTERCTFEGDMKQCRDDDECTYKSLCDGQRAHCPAPPAKPNKTECNMGTQVCWRGSCTGSICQKYDLEECFLNAKRGAKADEMCEVACQSRNQPSTCRPTSEIDIMQNMSGLKLRPGSPCNDYQGYCDVFQRCRPVDAEGPLARLKNLLFNKKTLINIKLWVTTYWWACTLGLFGAMLVMAAFIKCCAVHTPSSNPKRKKALRISDTLRRPADTLRRKSRERSRAAAASGGSNGAAQSHRSGGGARSNRDSSGGASGGGASSRNRSDPSHHRSNGGVQQSQQQILPLANIPPSSSSSATSHTNVSGSSRSGYPAHQAANSASSSSSSAGLSSNHGGRYSPPTLIVNLPPPSVAKDHHHHHQQQPYDPPPPYPGIPKPTAPPPPLPQVAIAPPSSLMVNGVGSGPSHGYGEGRGHYNRQQQQVQTNAPGVGASAKIVAPSKSGNAKKNDSDHHKSRR